MSVFPLAIRLYSSISAGLSWLCSLDVGICRISTAAYRVLFMFFSAFSCSLAGSPFQAAGERPANFSCLGRFRALRVARPFKQSEELLCPCSNHLLAPYTLHLYSKLKEVIFVRGLVSLRLSRCPYFL